MGIAESMKSLTSEILASCDVRVRALGDIIADTDKITADVHKTIKVFALNRKKASIEQAEALSDYAKDLEKNVKGLLKEFGKNRKAMSEEQSKTLSDFVKNLSRDVSSMLDGFGKNRSKTFKALMDKLAKEISDISSAVKNIVDNTQTLIGGYRSDMAKAKMAWQGMESILAKSRKGAVMPKIEAGEKVSTVEETIEKKGVKKVIKKKGKKAKR